MSSHSSRSLVRWSTRTAAACAAIAVVSLPPATAQDVTEPSLKAAFVYNFARFAEWPVETLPSGAPLVACTVDNAEIAGALERMVKGRQVMGRAMTIVRQAADAPPRPCHLVYAAGLNAVRIETLMAALGGTPVLTIVDSDALTRVPAVIRLFVENGNLRFDVDYGLAKRGRLQLSSKLLTLAKKVYDDGVGARRD